MTRQPPIPSPARVRLRRLAVAVALCATAFGASAQTADEPAGLGPTLSWSAFGTVGATLSDQPWRYQRFIDDDVRFERDTVFGAQVDAQLTPQWSATLQGKLAPSVRSDNQWDLTTTWAFAAWRPSNDWLLRAGKLRVPLFLRSEQLDVGATYDEARLPTEMYSMAPAQDFTGVHLTRSLAVGDGEASLEVYRGSGSLTKRLYVSEGLAPVVPIGPIFAKVRTTVQGLVLTWREPDLMTRVGVHHARTRRSGGDGDFLVRPTWVPLGPGIGYWQTSNNQFGPGVETVDRFDNLFLNLGGDVTLGDGWRVAGEISRVLQNDIELGVQATAAYATVYRSVGAFTPYATLASLRSSDGTLAWSQRLSTTRVPDVVPGAPQLNAAMRIAADTTPTVRQQSLALGTSYALTPTRKLKFEWLHTQARISQLIDVPAGEPLERRRRVNVLSASFSFVY